MNSIHDRQERIERMYARQDEWAQISARGFVGSGPYVVTVREPVKDADGSAVLS